MKTETKIDYHERMTQVLLHIQAHLDNALSLDELAASVHFSPLYFHRWFKGMTGESVAAHMRRLRLERAALRMATNRLSVTDAAFDAGYDSVEAFSRAFKRHFGCPPSKFPEQHWQGLMQQLSGCVHYQPETMRGGVQFKPLGGFDMEVRIETIDPIKVLFVRHTGPYAECGRAWKTLCGWAFPKGLVGEDAMYLGICHDDPNITPPEKIRYDACISVEDGVEQGEGEVGITSVEGGRYAVVEHCGSYMKFQETYAAMLGGWLPESGEQLRDVPSFEQYKNNVETTPEEDLRTDIYIPLK